MEKSTCFVSSIWKQLNASRREMPLLVVLPLLMAMFSVVILVEALHTPNKALTINRRCDTSTCQEIPTAAFVSHRNGRHKNTSNQHVVLFSSINTQKDTNNQKAGTDGYSILRQPLDWDTTKDPRFDTPVSLDETKDAPQRANSDWFDAKKRGGRNGNKSAISGDYQNLMMEQELQGPDAIDRLQSPPEQLNLFQRTMDTLDYPIVLKALRKECGTAPAKSIIQNAMQLNVSNPNEKKKLQQKQRQQKTNGGNNDQQGSEILSMGLTATNVDGIHSRYQALKEMKRVLSGSVNTIRAASKRKEYSNNNTNKPKSKNKKLEPPPLSTSSFDMEPIFAKVDEYESVLDGPDILEVSSILDACAKVGDWCMELELVQRDIRKKQRQQNESEEGVSTTQNDLEEEEEEDSIEFIELPKLGQSIFVDPDLQSLLSNAFDEEGKLSGSTFPSIGRLRSKVRTLKNDILSSLETLVSSPSIKTKLSLESGGALYSEVNGRIVIPISDKYKNSVGIVHDASRSGKTSYVEPTEVVGPTNEMRQAEVELRQEENRVWRMLTKEILEHREDIEKSIASVGQLDLVLARIRLGDKLAGVIPVVKDDGVISLKKARHPVLLLRELANVVGSDIDIGAGDNQGMVLTGPNSGGKTVVLKLMGLCALMARDGIPVPAQPDEARVDFFGPILADIGDLQSVDGDLSTFSGHMLVCREVLANSGKNALVLMDELGSGTDPNQGVAIAQSLLEALVDTGARVAITTHYMELKQLAASDSRFSVGGMQFVNGRPTYKLLPGVVGESFALSVAERLNLPERVIERASELLDSETRQMGDLIRDMEDQKALIDKQAADLKRKQDKLDELEQEMRKKQERLEREQIFARKNEAKKFAAKLEEKEKILEQVLDKLKSDPSRKLVARSWDELKYVKRDALTEAENIPSVLRRKQKAAAVEEKKTAELVPLSEMREKPTLNPGDTLIVCKPGALMGTETKIINVSGKRVSVNVRGMAMQMKMTELSLPTQSFPETKGNNNNNNNNKRNQMSKMARKALADEENNPNGNGYGKGADNSGGNSGVVMRTASNTVDVLGCNFEEARRKCEDKFSRAMMNKNAVVYILHGHGTQGVLKQKIRDWLRREKQWVKKFKPADSSDGGDAFTMVELKKMKM